VPRPLAMAASVAVFHGSVPSPLTLRLNFYLNTPGPSMWHVHVEGVREPRCRCVMLRSCWDLGGLLPFRLGTKVDLSENSRLHTFAAQTPLGDVDV
jgi:hypothetical protein